MRDISSSIRGQRPKAHRGIQLAALLFGILMIGQCLMYGYGASGLTHAGTLGLKLASACSDDRFCKVTAIQPGSPADRAGITVDDEIRLDRYWQRYRIPDANEPTGITVRGKDGATRPLVLNTAVRPMSLRPTYIIVSTANIAVCLIALILLFRAGRNTWVLLLGLALICYAMPGNYPRLWQNHPNVFPPVLVLLSEIGNIAPALMLAALRGFRKDVIGDVPRWLDIMVWGTTLGELVLAGLGAFIALDARPHLDIGDGLVLISLAWSAGSLLPPLALAAGWRRVPTTSRTRYSFMWLAVTVFSINPVIDPVIMLTGNDYVTPTWPVLTQISAIILGAILFAYAVLRHRVVDLGFAINRTLVFSSLSFLLLLTFGLLEWAGEKLLPEENHEASLIIEGVIALGVFLLFHRVHEWVEKNVERLFFHHWHAKARDLKRSVRQAAYITSADVLLQRAQDALSRYVGHDDVALYRLADAGYRRQSGHVPHVAATLDLDSAPLVTLRSEREALRDAFTPGDLLLPMLHRADVIGFVLLGPRPDQEPYRTDEEAELEHAVRQLGLDLYALRVEELERENLRLNALVGDRTDVLQRRNALGAT